MYMSEKSDREDRLIKLFLSAYENFSWADADCTKADDIERTRKAVDRICTRMSDGRTLAIEHTIVQPFIGDKGDFASFQEWFLEIEKDESLLVNGRGIWVYVPVGTLRKQPKESRGAIVQSVRCWIKSNANSLPYGPSQHRCPVTGISGKPSFDFALSIKVDRLQDVSNAKRGSLRIRRDDVTVDGDDVTETLGAVVKKALTDKLEKLVNTVVDKRILLLEWQHNNRWPERLLEEIEKLRPLFPDLAHVDEIWILQPIIYGTIDGPDLEESSFRFDLYEAGEVVKILSFENWNLIQTYDYGVRRSYPRCDLARAAAEPAPPGFGETGPASTA